MHLVVLHETRDILHSMAWHLSLIHSARPSLHQAWFHRLLRRSGDKDGKSLKRFALPSSFTCLPYELAGFAFLINFVHKEGEQFSQGCLWPSYVRFAMDPIKKFIIEPGKDACLL